MRSIGRLALPALVLLLALSATPAQATLLVKSNSTDGLVILDNNGLNDAATVTPETVDGQPGYRIHNFNLIDLFDFDFQAGCRDGGDREAICRRFNSKVNAGLVGGHDTFS